MRGRARAARRAGRGVRALGRAGATEIGRVSDTRRLRVFDGEELVGDMPVEALVDDCPLYDLEPEEPSAPVYPDPPAPAGAGSGAAETLLALLGSPNVASKRWVFEQYDSIVQSRTVRRPQAADAAVLLLGADGGQRRPGRLHRRQRPPGGLRPLHRRRRGRARVRAQPRLRGRGATRTHQLPQLWKSGEAPYRLAADPRRGGAARRLPRARGSGRGRERLALQRGRRGADLPHADRGDGRGGCPTRRRCRAPPSRARATWSRWWVRSRHRWKGPSWASCAAGWAPGFRRWTCAAQAEALEALRGAVRAGELATAHDVSEGGLACALAECCVEGGIGARVELSASDDEALFGEGPGGALVAGPREAVEAVPGARVIGVVGGEDPGGRRAPLAARGASCARPGRARSRRPSWRRRASRTRAAAPRIRPLWKARALLSPAPAGRHHGHRRAHVDPGDLRAHRRPGRLLRAQ